MRATSHPTTIQHVKHNEKQRRTILIALLTALSMLGLTTNAWANVIINPDTSPPAMLPISVVTPVGSTYGPGPASLSPQMLSTAANAASPTGIVSVNTAGVRGNGPSGGDSDYWPIAATPGRVTFTSAATNLDIAFNVPGNTNLVYSRSLTNNTTALVSLTAAGLVPNAGMLRFRMSANGQFLAFITSATNMSLGHDDGSYNLYVRDLASGVVTWAGTEQYFAIDDTGAITSSTAVTAQGASYLTYAGGQLYLVNRSTGARALVSATGNGTPANNQVFENSGAMSSDARYVAFFSVATNLVSNYINPCLPNNCGSIFLKDMSTGAIADLGASQPGIRLGFTPAVSANGDYVSFCGMAVNGGAPAVYVASRLSGLARRVDTDISGVVRVHSFDCPSALSTDGSRVFITGENIATGSVNQIFSESTAPAVTEADTAPPVLGLPSTLTLEATGPGGATVTYAATATDNTDPSPSVSCNPDTGTTFVVGTTTVDCTATDATGNTATGSFTVTVTAFDTTPPVVTGATDRAPNAEGWFTGPVTVLWSATDPDDATNELTTAADATVTTEGAGQIVTSAPVCDPAGNCASGTTTVSVDSTPPVVTLTGVAEGGKYLLANRPKPGCTATDTLSGLAGTCLVAVTGGNSNGVGVYIATGTATDRAGNTRTITVRYKVIYGWDGFSQPINDTAHQVGLATSVFKAGSTVPAKFTVTDTAGAPIALVSAPVWLTPTKGVATVLSVDESVYSDLADSGSTYQPAGDQWKYNWKTSTTQAGYHWRIGVRLDDGEAYYANIALR